MSIAIGPNGLGEAFQFGDAAAKANAAVYPVESEAPERADEVREAPEACFSRRAEAPDAGEGRTQYYEQDFTHGRSQS